MRDPTRTRRYMYRAGPAVALSALGLIALAQPGCGGDDETTPNPGTGGTSAGGSGGTAGAGGGGLAINEAVTDPQVRPFDTTPDSTAASFYFTALDTGTGETGVYKVPASGGAATAVHTGAPFVTAIGVAIGSDDGTLYVADPGVEGPNSTPQLEEPGIIFTLHTDGTGLTPIASTAGYAPRGIEVSSNSGNDEVYFTGIDPADGVPGVFRFTGTGAPTVVAKGGVFADPGGVTVGSDGTLYITDGVASSDTSGVIIKVDTNGTASVFMSGLALGFPSGIAVTNDDAQLIVSGQNPATGNAVIIAVDVASKAPTLYSGDADTDIGVNPEAAGLHRARGTQNIFSWAGLTADGRGAVYLVRF